MTEPAQLLSLSDLPAFWGKPVSARRVRQLRAAAGVGRMLAGAWILTPEEAERCRPKKTGRPKKGEAQ